MSTESPRLLTRVKGHMRARHLSPRTVRSYVGWIIRYIRYHGMRHPTELGEAEIVAYLSEASLSDHDEIEKSPDAAKKLVPESPNTPLQQTNGPTIIC